MNSNDADQALHRAIVDDDNAAVERLCQRSEMLQIRDANGFTPLDLARLLGKKEFQILLGGSLPSSIKVQRKSDVKPVMIPVSDFENYFQMQYHSFPLFESYDFLCEVVKLCPLTFLSPDENRRELKKRYGDRVAAGTLVPMYVKWIDETLNYGLVADDVISEGTYVGEYAGKIRHAPPTNDHEINRYAYLYPTYLWPLEYNGAPVLGPTRLAIDPRFEGNLMRFANHSATPNMESYCIAHQRIVHVFFVANRKIDKGTQLTFNYGKLYWNKLSVGPVDI